MATKKQASESDYIITTISMSVHDREENPIFGDSVITVSLEDDAAGPYIVLKSLEEELKPGEIKVDLDQLDVILEAARVLIKNYPDRG